IRGSQRGTVTGASGEYTLYNVPSRATIVVSNVGYQTREFRLSRGQANLSLTLLPEVSALSDVIVTGFQRIDKKQFTGAAVKLGMDQIKTEGVLDISRMLEGRAAGVAVQNVSGTFGAAPKIRIRGATSITGDNKPLWVVDGVVLEDIINISNDQLASGDPNTLLGSSVAGLNPSDIESFDILKDASATALYGARAMNGVIVITTRKGKAGSLRVNYSGNFSVQLKPSYSNYNVMNSADQMSVYAELERKGALNYSEVAGRSETGIYGKWEQKIAYDPAIGGPQIINTPENKAEFLNRYATANTDWFDVLFRNSFTQEHSLSLSHGSEKAQSYFSVSFTNDQGWTIADRMRRFTANLNNTYNFSNKLSAGFKVTGSVRQQKTPGTEERRDDPVAGAYDRDFDINPFNYALHSSRALTAYDENGELEYFRRNYTDFNIVNELRNNYIDVNVVDVSLLGNLKYKILPWMTYDFNGAIRYVNATKEHQITENANQANAYRAASTTEIADKNRFLYRDPDNPNATPVSVLPYGGFYNTETDVLKNYTFRNTLSFDHLFGRRHQINALIGQEVKYSDRPNTRNLGFGYQYENGGIPFVDYRIVKQYLENSFQFYEHSNEYERFVGYFGNLRYSYNNKYVLEGTLRRDGSNRLGRSSKARWLNSYTIAARWNAAEEDFIKNISEISYLTLRGSYGLNANYGDATNSLAVLKTKLTNRPYLTDKQLAIDIENLENSDLTWEKKYEANVGVDLGLLQNRLNISIDAYQRKSLDLISEIRTSAIGGQLVKVANYADLKSRGIEFSVGGTPVRLRNFSWQTNLTFGFNTNEITRAENFPLIYDLAIPEGGALEGHPVRGLFSIPFAGLTDEGVPTFLTEKGDTSSGVYLQSDQVFNLKYEGPIDPTILGGFTNTFSYKNLSLSLHISYQLGNKIRLYPTFRGGYSDLDALPTEFKNRWVLPGDELVTNIPSIVTPYLDFDFNSTGSYPYNIYNYSDARVVDGSFVRLKTVRLSYSIPEGIVHRTPFNNLTLDLTGNNLFLIYSDPDLNGQDPEFFNAGGVAQPLSKQV
ncbi:MAG TPA: SusC/RagA family TonB-linked outer membrane protein, partial [Flavitalea sp.]|nr:SusC/RagA family TonB-linked outer membrane protein [Flavitalea sp.]